MKCVKTLAIAAVAAMALMAFAASSASATALYNGATKLGVGAELDFTLKTGTSALLKETGAEGKTLDTCKSSTLRGNVTNAGGAGKEVEVSIAEEVNGKGETIATGLTWGSCTFPTRTVAVGFLNFSSLENTKAAVEAVLETGVTVNTILFGSCTYGVDLWHNIGTLTTSASGTAEFHANAVGQKTSTSNAACPFTAVWTAAYTGTTPDNLRVEAS